MRETLGVIGLLIFVVVLIVGLMSVLDRDDKIISDDVVVYKVVIIEGMPCIYMRGIHHSALTCDWSQYKSVKQ